MLSLPKNQFKSLGSNTKMQLDMFHSVLQSHQTIETLRVPIVQKSDDVPLSSTPWIGSCLRNLESLEVNLQRNHFDVDLDNHSFLVANAPKLKSLQIRGYDKLNLATRTFPNVPLGNMTLSISEAEVLTNLEHLSLSFLDFADSTALLDEIAFWELKSLRLKHCSNMGNFFQMLLPMFRKYGSKLEILEIEPTITPPHFNVSEISKAELKIVNRFLESFQGLKELYINYNYELKFKAGGLREVRAMIAHADTLKILCADSSRSLQCFDAEILNEILARCGKLNQLGVTIVSKGEHFTLHRKRHLDDLTGNIEIPPGSGAADRLVSKQANFSIANTQAPTNNMTGCHSQISKHPNTSHAG